MTEPLLRVESLSAGYGGRAVVSGVTFSLGRGERLVVMGPNGSGKSTLVKAIPLLVRPLGGRVLFRGVDLTALGERELARHRAKMGYLPQGGGLFPHMRVIDNVALPLRLVLKMGKSEARARAAEYLAKMGVAHLADRYPAQLSGGQAQRVALARALALEPDLLLLDEPTASLDPSGRAEVLEALYEVAGMGKAMVVVTHELEFAERAADKLLLVEGGRQRYFGPFSKSALGEELGWGV